jgi:hypothetical protein
MAQAKSAPRLAWKPLRASQADDRGDDGSPGKIGVPGLYGGKPRVFHSFSQFFHSFSTVFPQAHYVTECETVATDTDGER